MGFKGKTAMITGAARGIGLEIARVLAERGADLVLIDLNEEGLAEAAKMVSDLGSKVKTCAINVTDEERIEAACAEVIDEFGKIDILVNNAGITRDGLMLRMEQADWDAVINVNLKGTFLMTKVVARYMLRSRSGSIVNLASFSGLHGNAGQANYAASKAAVVGFTKTVARELAVRGITCNAVAPGFIDTAMTQALPEKAKEGALKAIPMKRMGTSREVALAVAFLAGDESAYITGQVLPIDGGLGA